MSLNLKTVSIQREVFKKLCFDFKNRCNYDYFSHSGCYVPRRLRRCGGIKDLRVWECPNCRSRKSIRTGSFFSNSNKSLQELISFIYFWAQDWTQVKIIQESAGDNPPMDHKTSTRWALLCREECQKFFLRHPDEQVIGGFNVDAQVKKTVVQ